ncbi:Zn(2+) transporter ZRG17 Ecym_2516 [Eremothecium cymbalariae DBVPG|uniref:Protein ZRG17 n=1 Tax=Eremothecium cymbalariae (strain CBS 270.75 / DBVPG 7215 / KCTC 17166 / NRRL Y-17582) TaxID=931890 RepID=G8JPX9_ERECY|nr:Hypothetical protein Ecym_2516 [Eremothecium cymbalariae DBVPG\
MLKVSNKEEQTEALVEEVVQTPPRKMNRIVEEDTPPLAEEPCNNSPLRQAVSLYSLGGANDSSSSLVMNKGFTFGGDVSGGESNSTSWEVGMPGAPGSGSGSSKRNSLNLNNAQAWKYIPQPKLPPVMRTHSPSPDQGVAKGQQQQRGSLIMDGAPFNFSSSSLQPPTSSSSRASFRRGHRYKHSSVSMNFFQEPEVKVPLNIAKSLPIPDLSDLHMNMKWPIHHLQLGLTLLQAVLCMVIFHLGQRHEWGNFLTLSHFIVYDILGSLTIIVVDILSQFEVWGTGTITYPFGLNRIDVLLSFGFAVSLCFVGLDLIFHILEEVIVLFVENGNHDQHADIVESIPHSHHTHVESNSLPLWYLVLCFSTLLTVTALCTTFNTKNNTDIRYKTKTPIITLAYTSYLLCYPITLQFTDYGNYVATISIALLIISYGLNVVAWTGTVLLLGFSATPLEAPGLQLLSDTSTPKLSTYQQKIAGLSVKNPHPTSARLGLQRLSDNYEPTVLKARIIELIEQLPHFKINCSFNYSDLVISKVNFDLFIVLLKLNMNGGSNEEELDLRLAIHNCIKTLFSKAETTIEIERV